MRKFRKEYSMLYRRAMSQPMILTPDEKKLNALYFGTLGKYQRFKEKLLKRGWMVELHFFGNKPSHLLNRSSLENMIVMEEVIINLHFPHVEHHYVRPRLHKYLTGKERKELKSQLTGGAA